MIPEAVAIGSEERDGGLVRIADFRGQEESSSGPAGESQDRCPPGAGPEPGGKVGRVEGEEPGPLFRFAGIE